MRMASLPSSEIAAAAGVRVHETERRLLGLQRLDQADQDRVLEHVGEVAGMEGMAIIHGIRTSGAPAAPAADLPDQHTRRMGRSARV